MEELEDAGLFSIALFSIYALCSVNVAALQFVTAAPYGKHVRAGWGPSLPAPLAWFLMESSTLWLTLLLYPCGRHRSHPVALAVLSLSLSSPLRPPRPRLPASPPLLLLLQESRRLSSPNRPLRLRFQPPQRLPPVPLHLPLRRLHGAPSPGLVAGGGGGGDFLLGHDDQHHIGFGVGEAQGRGGRVQDTQRGGWFELVSCPNYIGEMMEYRDRRRPWASSSTPAPTWGPEQWRICSGIWTSSEMPIPNPGRHLCPSSTEL